MTVNVLITTRLTFDTGIGVACSVHTVVVPCENQTKAEETVDAVGADRVRRQNADFQGSKSFVQHAIILG